MVDGGMARKKTLPGSIYVQTGSRRLMIKFKGRRISTGLQDTQEGRRIAAKLLEQLYLESMGVQPATIAQDKHTIRLDDAFDKFLEVHCSNKSKTTRSNYTLAYKTIARTNYTLTVENLEADVLYYIKTARERGHTDISINSYLTQFQVFLNFCTKRGWLPATNFKSQHRKKVQYTVQVFTDEEVRAILEYFAIHDPECGAMIEVMMLTGARVIDALTLTWVQVHEEERSITFQNKISKQPELVPVLPRVMEVLNTLPRNRAKVFRWEYISQSHCHKLLNQAMRACGIEKKGRSFQEFRTSYRNNLLDAGVAPELVMKLMRHRDLTTTTKHYTRVTNDMLQKSLEKMEFGQDLGKMRKKARV